MKSPTKTAGCAAKQAHTQARFLGILDGSQRPRGKLVQRVLGKPHAPVGLVLINDRLDLVDLKLEPKLGRLQVIRKPKTEQELYRDI